MANLQFSHGEGQLIRTATTLLFAAEPLPAVVEMVRATDHLDFKALASLIVSEDFQLPAFVAFDLDHGNIFVFGDIVVEVGTTTFNGSTTSTWIEKRLDSPQVIACGNMPQVDGELKEGWSRAAGFVLDAIQVAPSITVEPSKKAEPSVRLTMADEASAPAPEPEPTRHSLRFDDGEDVDIQVGAYIGRHPTKNGLPDGYTSVTVGSEHVSRLHWELSIEGGKGILRDLGSNEGTEVEVGGSRHRVPAGGMALSPGATIHFADRNAVYEVV